MDVFLLSEPVPQRLSELKPPDSSISGVLECHYELREEIPCFIKCAVKAIASSSERGYFLVTHRLYII